MVTKGGSSGERGNWINAVKMYEFLVIRYISTRNVMYNMMNINNTAVMFSMKAEN